MKEKSALNYIKLLLLYLLWLYHVSMFTVCEVDLHISSKDSALFSL